MDPVRWGFLGSGWLVNARTAAAVHDSSNGELTAVAARDLERAKLANPRRAYDNYQAIIDDPEIEAVYIALANDVHLHWMLKALEAGKHVLCEKPMTMSADHTRTAFAKAEEKGLLLVEAVWARWHPRMQRIVRLARSGELGALTHFEGRFTWETADAAPPGNYRYFPEYGGGALLDLGIYPLHTLMACVPDAASLEVAAASQHLNEHGADLTTDMTLRWAAGPEHATANGGPKAEITVSFEQPLSEALHLVFEHGEIATIDNEAFGTWHQPARLRVNDTIETFDSTDAYRLMFEAVSGRIRGGDDWVLSPRESIIAAELVDAAFARSAGTAQ